MSLEVPLFSCWLEECGVLTWNETIHWNSHLITWDNDDNSHLMVRNLTKKLHGHQVSSNRFRSQIQMHWKDPAGLWTRFCHTDKLITVGHGEQRAENYKSKHPHGQTYLLLACTSQAPLGELLQPVLTLYVQSFCKDKGWFNAFSFLAQISYLVFVHTHCMTWFSSLR